jgi:hypothetical protein
MHKDINPMGRRTTTVLLLPQPMELWLHYKETVVLGGIHLMINLLKIVASVVTGTNLISGKEGAIKL